ncbi:MAG: hypothetical protein R6X27_19540 [Candidatus Desulfacyla sp.]
MKTKLPVHDLATSILPAPVMTVEPACSRWAPRKDIAHTVTVVIP